MGRIKTQQVKRIGQEMFRKYPSEFQPTFKENKELVSKHANFASKKIRNLVAGYITRQACHAKQI